MSECKTKLQFPPEFFKREERSGHMVGELMKRTWAAELEMLAHVDEICQKYGLTYYAYWGTLLGAVRHNGFIPWDDDLDIAMRREDYNKFLEVAPKELPEGYQILNNYVQEWDNSITKISNSKKIDFGADYMERFHNCPFAVGIDIFPLDYIPRDAQAASEQKELLTFIGNITSVVVGRKEEAEAGATAEELAEYDQVLAESLADLEQICGVRFDYSKSILQQLNILFDQISGMFTADESDEITLFFKYLIKGYSVKKELLEEVLLVPFENITIPIPNGYDAILGKSYKDYMTPRKLNSTHGDIYFREQIGVLADILNERCKKSISVEEEMDLLKTVDDRLEQSRGRRKVILMCNNISEMLVHDGVAVKKMRAILRAFEKNEGVMLWWRPSRIDLSQMDELLKVTPQMVLEYRELIREYEEKQLGVLDKGVSLERVLKICDAYYGDDNEIAREFQRVGKYVMIADYTV